MFTDVQSLSFCHTRFTIYNSARYMYMAPGISTLTYLLTVWSSSSYVLSQPVTSTCNMLFKAPTVHNCTGNNAQQYQSICYVI